MRIYSEPHICHCLTRLATIRRNSPLTISGDRRKTGEQFVQGVLSLARGLYELGLKSGDIIAISALNSDLYLEWLLAVTFVGGIVAPLNYRWSLEEAKSAMEVVRPVMLVTDTINNYWHSKFESDSFQYLTWHVIMNRPIELKNTVLTTESLKKPSLRHHSFNYSWAPEGVAIICFTSGTTGKPKGVTLSHSSLIVQSLAKIAVVGYGVFAYNTVVPHRRIIFSDGNINGMTEACSSITFMTLHDPTSEENGVTKSPSIDQVDGVCVGKPAPHVELKISFDDSFNVGRILTRGPHLMIGYWGKKSVVKDSNHDDEGWLDTGDIGRIDDSGDLWLIGRFNGRIKSGGENVYPEEVEAVLSKHPGILKTVIIGIPDSRFTEMVVACIQIKDNWTWTNFNSENNMLLSHEILHWFCRQNNLTGFKIPKKFIIWKKQFPLTTGKLRRDEVRRECISHLQFLPSNL